MTMRVLLIAAALLAGCGDDWSEPRAKPAAVGTLGPGFVNPADPPAPEATITPRPGSWDGVHPPEGYRVVLLTVGEDRTTEAVRAWAEREDVRLKTVTAANPTEYIERIVEAMELQGDLIVAVGDGLVDPLAVVTANHLDRQFLLVGSELPEPTENVTAVRWGSDPERAIRAGVAAVLHGWTGIALRLDEPRSVALAPRS